MQSRRIASLRPLSQERLRAWLQGSGRSTRQFHLAGSAPTMGSLVRTRRRPMVASGFHSSRMVAEDSAAKVDVNTPGEDSTTTEAVEKPHPTEIQYEFTPPPPLSEASQEKVDELFDKVLWLDMIEVHLLTQLVHEQMGFKWSEVDTSSGPVAAGARATTAEEAPQEKALKDVKLVGFDAKAKIKVIKEVRAIAGLGLKEAKELVESAPKLVQKELTPEKAEELKAQLEAVGAQVEIV
jgi:large subunit ribosomal protein L7/L12